MKARFSFLFLVAVAAALLLPGCATGGGGTRYPAAAAPPPHEVSFSVLEFKPANPARLQQADRGVREFEGMYFPAKMVSSLRAMPGVSAFYSMAGSPATDFVVHGSIVQSNGRQLSLRVAMTRVDGSPVFSKTFAVEHEDAREHVVVPKMNRYFQQIARELVAKARMTRINLKEGRARAYAENGAIAVPPAVLEDSELAASIERESILTPLTASLLPRAEIASKVYTQWQKETIPLEKERDIARIEKSMATVGSALSLAGGAASVAQGYQFAQQGNQQGVQLANQGLSRAGTMMIQAEGAYREAANREQAILKALAVYKTQFISGAPRQVTIRIYGKLLTLSGSQQEMLAEFRKVVKKKLNASGQPGSA